MSFLLDIAVEARLAVLFVLGVLAGTQANRAIYRLAWFARPIGPWSAPSPAAPPRRAADRLPILGWFFLRRESPLHGRGYWIRPLLIELAMGGGFAWIYWYETVQHGVAGFDPGPATLHAQCLTHLILLWLMVVATFIDFDEQTIPDAITLPGTLLGLTIAAVIPTSRALVAVPAPVGFRHEFLHLASATAVPGMPSWPAWLDGFAGLAIGIACLVSWAAAVMPWTWTLRKGWAKAVQFALASLARRAGTWPLVIVAVVGSVLTAVVWGVGGDHWQSLLSALVGMAVGGGIIWAVRVVGSYALGQEAMGFGDVTLMAMIGAFTGWQATPIIFVLAPFSAIFIAVAQYLLTRRHDIAFGPYLCLAALIWLLNSGDLWRQYGLPIFSMGWFVPALGSCSLLLMWGMLVVLRWLRGGR